ncbi:MAG: FeoA family protein [Desulfobulbus sp.]|nr:FeoA family protein [Desulfobulbus sp.]
MPVDQTHNKEPRENTGQVLNDLAEGCPRRKRWCRQQRGMPLHEACCRGRMRVCAVNGDRRTCAKMANLGLLPGSELELLCSGGGRQCMIKVNGGTISLDALSAANILVAPL